MIPSITRYASTGDLLVAAQRQALQLPGQSTAHVIGAWRPISTLPPPGSAALDSLAGELNALLRAHRAGRDERPGRSRDVWHCAIRDHPDAPRLTDSQWAATARRVLAATGIVPPDDPSAGCRWVALRTGSHEVRIIAPLMRPDGTVPPLHRDHSLAHAACQLADLELSAGRRRVQAARAGHGPVSSAAPATVGPTWLSAHRPSTPHR